MSVFVIFLTYATNVFLLLILCCPVSVSFGCSIDESRPSKEITVNDIPELLTFPLTIVLDSQIDLELFESTIGRLEEYIDVDIQNVVHANQLGDGFDDLGHRNLMVWGYGSFLDSLATNSLQISLSSILQNLTTGVGCLAVTQIPEYSQRYIVFAIASETAGMNSALYALGLLTEGRAGYIRSSGKHIEMIGEVKMMISSVLPDYASCPNGFYNLVVGDESFFLDGICPFLILLDGQSYQNEYALVSISQNKRFNDQITIMGKLEQRVWGGGKTQHTQGEKVSVIVVDYAK